MNSGRLSNIGCVLNFKKGLSVCLFSCVVVLLVATLSYTIYYFPEYTKMDYGIVAATVIFCIVALLIILYTVRGEINTNRSDYQAI